MQQLVVASNNPGKILEITSMINDIELLSMADIGFTQEIPEPYDSFEENALAKASAIYSFCNKNTFADDSGLCVEALNGAPGVISAHYSGSRHDGQNLQKVLDELQGIENRKAFYKAVICLIWDGEVYYFEGICRGAIAQEPAGTGGFGYDPAFIPDGHTDTFGQLQLTVKNAISHRGAAVRKMVDFLQHKIADSAL